MWVRPQSRSNTLTSIESLTGEAGGDLLPTTMSLRTTLYAALVAAMCFSQTLTIPVDEPQTELLKAGTDLLLKEKHKPGRCRITVYLICTVRVCVVSSRGYKTILSRSIWVTHCKYGRHAAYDIFKNIFWMTILLFWPKSCFWWSNTRQHWFS